MESYIHPAIIDRSCYPNDITGDPSEKDITIMRDFNADESYFDEDSASLLKDGFHWVITNDMDTMTKTDWTYDRIVFKDSTLNEYVADSANVFYFDQVYGIGEDLTTSVSDHYPVWAEFLANL